MNSSITNAIHRIVCHVYDPIKPRTTTKPKQYTPWRLRGRPVISPEGKRYDTVGVAIADTGLSRCQIYHSIHYQKRGWRYAEAE